MHEAPSVACSHESHAAARTSLAALAVAVGGRLQVWVDRPRPGWLLVSGQCGCCHSTLGREVTDGEWVAFGAPVPAHVVSEAA